MSIASDLIAAGFEITSEVLGGDVQAMRPHDTGFETITGAVLGSERNERIKRIDGGVDVVRVRDAIVEELKLPGSVARIDLVWQIDGDNYSTTEFNRVDGGLVSFKIQRVEANEITRKNYRGGR